jgi:hypothetical protein
VIPDFNDHLVAQRTLVAEQENVSVAGELRLGRDRRDDQAAASGRRIGVEHDADEQLAQSLRTGGGHNRTNLDARERKTCGSWGHGPILEI